MSLNRPARIALLSSLLLNVALLAMLAVWGLGRHAGPDPSPPRTEVSEADRERFREAMSPYRDGIRANYRDVREARAAVATTLRAEPLDVAALEAAFTALREAEARAAAASHEALTASAAQVDATVRERMAERIEQRGRERRGHGGNRDRRSD